MYLVLVLVILIGVPLDYYLVGLRTIDRSIGATDWRERCIAVGTYICMLFAWSEAALGVITYYAYYLWENYSQGSAAAWLLLSVIVYVTLVGATSSLLAGAGVLVGGAIASSLMFVDPPSYARHEWLFGEIMLLLGFVVWHFSYVISMSLWSGRVQKANEHRCRKCGYDKRGLPGVICPECGGVIVPDGPP